MNYLDTSALIKRFVTEPGSRAVDALMTAPAPVATAKVAYAEVYSGLTRKRREGYVAEGAYRSACRRFEAEWRACVQVELTDEILRLARDVIRRHALRAFDAVHIASALGLKIRLGEIRRWRSRPEPAWGWQPGLLRIRRLSALPQLVVLGTDPGIERARQIPREREHPDQLQHVG